MSCVLNCSNEKYRRFVLWPLCVLLIILTGIELKMDIIPDKLVFPAGLYFTIMAARIGPLRWWRYPLALVSILLALLVLAYSSQELLGWQSFGGGAIKIMTVIGGSVGLAIGFETMAIWLLVVAAAVAFTNISALPSSPLIAVALYIAMGRRYGFNFLFAKLPTVAIDEPKAVVIDVPPPLSTKLPAKPLPAFFKLPPAPTLMFQGGMVVAIGSGVLSKQLQKMPDHSIIAALAIEGLRVASLVGIVCFIVGWVKTRKQK